MSTCQLKVGDSENTAMSSDFQRQMPGGQSADQSHWLYKVHLDPILLALAVLCSALV